MPNDYTPDGILKRLDTPEECDQFAINVREKYPDVAMRAGRRAVELRAQQYGPETEVERDALQVICAYEAVLKNRNGKKTRATRTWQMIKKHGLVQAIERAVDRETDTMGFKALTEMGMQDWTFESLVLRHPDSFSPNAVSRCQEKMKGDDWKISSIPTIQNW